MKSIALNLYEVRYVNQCHLKANRQLVKKLTPVYIVAVDFPSASVRATENKPADHDVFSVTLEQRNINVFI